MLARASSRHKMVGPIQGVCTHTTRKSTVLVSDRPGVHLGWWQLPVAMSKSVRGAAASELQKSRHLLRELLGLLPGVVGSL
eukprot:11965247-Alexandrium_andersonii.AAC.1